MNPRPCHGSREATLANGDTIVIRPVRPDDEAMMVRFHEGLSDVSVYLRYFHMMKLAERTAHARLARICRADQDAEIVVVAEGRDEERGGPAILGVARLERTRTAGRAEFAVIVADRVQGNGVGSALMRRIVDIARLEGMSCLCADVLSANAAMRRLCARVGIPIRPTGDPGIVLAELVL
jgi:acetyltransferase